MEVTLVLLLSLRDATFPIRPSNSTKSNSGHYTLSPCLPLPPLPAALATVAAGPSAKGLLGLVVAAIVSCCGRGGVMGGSACGVQDGAS
jgi:hypothetical protein